VIISLHLVIEYFALLRLRIRDKLVLNNFQDVGTYIFELSLNLSLVRLNQGQLVGIALLLDGGDNSPTGASRSDHVLIRNGQQIPLLDGELLRLLGNGLHVVDHLIESEI
jgi:hypothetical protein